MLEKNFVLVISFVVFIPIIFILLLKHKRLEEIINYIFFHLAITLGIRESLFPMIVQEAIIENNVYQNKKQTLKLFSELRLIFSLKFSREQYYSILRIHVITIILPLFLMGIFIGFVIKMQFKSNKRFIIISFISVVAIQLVKLLTCVFIGAKYIQVTPEDALYIFLGCIFGGLMQFVVRLLIRNIEYKSAIFIALKKTLCGHM